MGLLGWQELAGARASGSLGRSTHTWLKQSEQKQLCVLCLPKARQLQGKQFHGSAIQAGIAQHFLGTSSKMRILLTQVAQAPGIS